MSRPIDYLESAVSDRPHSQMDRLLFEDEMDKDPLSGLVQNPQYSMSVPRTPHPEDALPIGQGAKIIGNIISGKYVPDRVLKKRIADSKLADSFAEKIKELKKFIDDRGFMGYASSSEITKAKKKMKELRDSYDELRPAMKGRNFQQGGPAERPPLLGYMNPAVQDEKAHSQIDNIIEDNTVLGHVTGLLSNLGIMDEPIKHAAGLPPLTTTKGHEELDWLGERLTREPDIEFHGGPGGALEAIGAVGKAGSLISATKDPVWKYATGKSLLKAMESSIKESLPKIYPKKPRKWLSEGALKKEAWWPGKGQLSQPKVSEEGRKELEKIAKALHNIDLNLPKTKPMKPTDLDKIEDARNALDASLAGGISEYAELGTMSPSRVKYIDNLSKSMKSVANKYYSKPENINEFENMQKSLIEYYEPTTPKVKAGGKYRTEVVPLSQNEKWSWLTKELNRWPPTEQKRILGTDYNAYKIWNTLIGRTGDWGAARGNLKLKPDVLNPDIVPVGRRRPK